MSDPKVNSYELFKRIQAKYARPAWAVFGEVGDSVGFKCNRHADALAISIWPSRGLEIHGFEIKCARSDWKKELADPAKAHAIQKYCDRWWIVISEEKIVEPGELPPNWGLMVAKGKGLTVKTAAPKLTPEALRVDFVAAVLRRQADLTDSLVSKAHEEGRQNGIKNGAPEVSRVRSELNTVIEDLKKTINYFEEESGLKINKWNAGDVGAAVQELLQLRYSPDPIKQFKRIREEVASLGRDIDRRIEIIESVMTTESKPENPEMKEAMG